MTASSIPLPDTSDPSATVRSYIDAFNRGDSEAMSKLCADPMSILDGMAPHVWHGSTSTADWYREVLIEGEHLGASEYNVELGDVKHNNITGENAYVVLPTTMRFKLQGKKVTQTGAFFTVALRKVGEDWLISLWAWTKGTAAIEP